MLQENLKFTYELQNEFIDKIVYKNKTLFFLEFVSSNNNSFNFRFFDSRVKAESFIINNSFLTFN